MEPVSISLAVIALLGSIVTGLYQLLAGKSVVKSSCCVFDDHHVEVKKSASVKESEKN